MNLWRTTQTTALQLIRVFNKDPSERPTRPIQRIAVRDERRQEEASYRSSSSPRSIKSHQAPLPLKMAPLLRSNMLSPRQYPFQQVLDPDLPSSLNDQMPPILVSFATTSIFSLASIQLSFGPVQPPQISPCKLLTEQKHHKRQYRPKNRHHHIYTAAQKRFREKWFLIALLGLLVLVSLIAGILIL